MCVRKWFYFHFQYLFLRNLKIVTGVKVSLLQLFLCNITNIVGSSCGGLVGLPVDGPDGSSLHEQPKWRSSLLQPRPGRPPLVATNMVHPQSVLPVGAWWAEPAPTATPVTTPVVTIVIVSVIMDNIMWSENIVLGDLEKSPLCRDLMVLKEESWM